MKTNCLRLIYVKRTTAEHPPISQLTPAMTDQELAETLVERSYRERRPPEEPFLLASGKTSYHYFECQRTTSWAPALPLFAAAFWRQLDSDARCIGGLTRGADPI